MKGPYDVIIHGGLIVDGSGAPPAMGDVAIRDGKIVVVGQVEGDARERIDATGRLVTPGFVDIHTHYDGHVTWTDRLLPSAQHGVTTVVGGNCGMGFAPCRPEDRKRLIALMEGVEDIPEAVMTAGMPWNWETFPEYLDRVAERYFDMDVALQVPHAAVRVYVMGHRAAAFEQATPEDIAQMRAIAREGIEAGALGFSTSRHFPHRSRDGTQTPTYGTEADELAGIALGLRDAGRGVLQYIGDWDDPAAEMAIVRRMMEESGRPLATSLIQLHIWPDRWRQLLDQIEQASADGYRIKGQVFGRPVGIMMGLELGRNPFMHAPAYQAIAHLPAHERAALMRDPACKRRILDQLDESMDWVTRTFVSNFKDMYDFDEAGYEPAPSLSLAAKAAASGEDVLSAAYDLIVRGDGDAILYAPVCNYHQNSTAQMQEMLTHKDTVLGLGDGGAHLNLICDASYPTYMLQRWADTNGGPLPIEQVVKALSSEPAHSVGLEDRGIVAPGYRADINIIDIGGMALGRPEIVRDLPDGATRLGQSARGYEATLVAGEITYARGEPTGRLPGRLIRGPQSAPAAVPAAA